MDKLFFCYAKRCINTFANFVVNLASEEGLNASFATHMIITGAIFNSIYTKMILKYYYRPTKIRIHNFT